MSREEKEESLADVLTEVMKEARVGDERLETLVTDKAILSTPPNKSNIRNWRNGTVKSVRDWRQLIAIALALNLDAKTTNRLLKAGTKSSISELLTTASVKDQELLSRWTQRLVIDEIRDQLEKIGEIGERVEHIERLLEHPSERATSSVEIELPSPNESLLEASSLPPQSRVNLNQNPYFIGREVEFRLILKLLKENKKTAIVGLGGIGKTQLAVEFAHRYGKFFPGAVFFLSCADSSQIDYEIAACGGLEGLALHANFEQRPLAEQVKLVKRAWREPVPRLLILDNVEDETLLEDLIPPFGGCRVLITSRRGRWSSSLGIEQVELDGFSRHDSVAFLQKFVPLVSDKVVADIANELGDLPIALHLAGSFLSRYQRVISPNNYLDELKSKELLKHQSLEGRAGIRSPTAHEMNLARTFELSFNRLNSSDVIDARALQLITNAAYFAPGEPLPIDLLKATFEQSAGDSSFQLQVEDGLARLTELGLIRAEDRFIYMHRLVNTFVRGKRKPTVSIEESVLPELKRLNSLYSITPLRSWMPHLHYLTQEAQARNDMKAATWCHSFGVFSWWRREDPERALSYLLWALKVQEEHLGELHDDTIQTLKAVGMVYGSLDQLEAAQSCHERVLALRIELSGTAHNEVSQTLNNLGYMLIRLGKLERVKKLLEQSLELKIQTRGPDHIGVAIPLSNLGLYFQLVGDYVNAYQFHQRSFAIVKANDAPGHILIVRYFQRLGLLLHAMGEIEEAEYDLEESVILLKEARGADHPVITKDYKDLGLIFEVNGDKERARLCFEYALKLATEILGDEHEGTLEVTGLLARVTSEPS